MNLPKLTVSILAGATAFAVVLAGCGGSGREVMPSVSVPNLIGKDTLSAQALLRQRGLHWRWEEGVRPGIANGFITDTIEGQAPAVGRRVKRGTVILISPGRFWSVGRNTILNPYG